MNQRRRCSNLKRRNSANGAFLHETCWCWWLKVLDTFYPVISAGAGFSVMNSMVEMFWFLACNFRTTNIEQSCKNICTYTRRRLRLPKVRKYFLQVFWVFMVPVHLQTHTTTFRVLNFRDWFGVSTPVTTPISEPGQTKEPGRTYTYL